MQNKNQISVQKRIITRKCGELLERMVNSKNDLERVEILQQMDQILQDEIDQWRNTILDDLESSESDHDALLDAAAVHITDLESIQAKIAPQVAEFLPKALELQAHKLRTGELSEPIIKNEFQ